MSSQAQSFARKRLISDIIVNGALLLLVLAWTIPTLGLLVSSFRTRFDIQTSGWWWVLPHREWVTIEEIEPGDDLDRDGEMEIFGVTGTFEEFREGISTPDGGKVSWVGNTRLGRIEVQERKWTMRTDFTLENYGQVLAGKEYEIQTSDGETKTVQGDNFLGSFLNSLTISVPATVIPILIAAFAAYGFAWMNFPGRKPLFTMVVALMVVPLQIALVPILQDYVKLDLNGTFLAVWLAHTGFGLPLATYLLFNYIKGLPRDILESAFIDGASHFTIFTRLILPLSIPERLPDRPGIHRRQTGCSGADHANCRNGWLARLRLALTDCRSLHIDVAAADCLLLAAALLRPWLAGRFCKGLNSEFLCKL